MRLASVFAVAANVQAMRGKDDGEVLIEVDEKSPVLHASETRFGALESQCMGQKGIIQVCSDYVNWKSFKDGVKAFGSAAENFVIAGIQSACFKFVSSSAKSGSNHFEMIGHNQLSQQFTTILEQLKACRVPLVDSLAKIHTILTSESEKHVAELPAAIQSLIQKFDILIAMRLTSMKSGYDTEQFQKLKRIIFIRHTMLASFPAKPRNIFAFGKYGSETEQQEAKSKIENLLRDIPAEHHDVIKRLSANIRYNSLPDIDPEYAERTQAYFFGPAGTGKSYFAEKFADSVGLPICKVAMNHFEPFIASNRPIMDAVEFDPFADPIQIFGLAYVCLLKTGVTNPIIYIDEAGEMLEKIQKVNSQMLEFWNIFFDPDHKLLKAWKWESPELEIDLTKITILIAGNTNITKEALKSRLPQIDFLSMDKGKKAQIIRMRYEEEKERVQDKTDIDYSASAIDEKMETVMDLMVNELDSEPGTREVEQATLDVFKDLVLMAANEQQLPSDDDLESLARQAYYKRTSKN